MKMSKKWSFLSGVGTLLVGLFIAGPANATVWVLSGDMDAAQATTNPGNVGIGTGTIAGNYDDVTNELNYTITWMDLTAPVTVAHFHIGAPGVPGGVDLLIPGPYVSPLTDGSVLNASQENNLLSGLWYVNIHTQQFLGGEIRGQVLVEPIPIPAAAWLFGSGLIALAAFARRRRG